MKRLLHPLPFLVLLLSHQFTLCSEVVCDNGPSRHFFATVVKTLAETLSHSTPYFQPPDLPVVVLYGYNPQLMSSSPFELRQSNFTEGTVRLKGPGKYILMEDITFAPSSSWPDCGTAYKREMYCGGGVRPTGAFHLGFFAAVTLEGQDVHLDLNGFVIQQSLKHSLQQRFFAIVETGSSPFIIGQGPGDFTEEQVIGCQRCSVANGSIGRSSHHGIHGNGNIDISFRDLIISDHEVAGISLNGPQRCSINGVVIKGHSRAVLARATLSASRYLLRFFNAIPVGINKPESLVEAMEMLQALEDDFIASSVVGTLPSPEAQHQFGNPGHLIDGNAYGIAIHGRGVLVNSFGQTMPSNISEAARSITIENTRIEGVSARVTEVVTICSRDNQKPMVDVAGSVFRIDEIHAPDGSLRLDALHTARLEYARFVKSLPPSLSAHAKGTMNVDDDLWEAYFIGQSALEAALRNYTRVCNSDSMHHANKGTIGLFIQRTRNVKIKNVTVAGVTNVGDVGSSVCGKYQTSQWTGHLGYTGSQSYGVVVTTSKTIDISGLHIENVFSKNAASYGITLFNNVEDVISTGIQGIHIQNITSGFIENGPNDPPRCYPIAIGNGISLENVKITTMK